MLDAQNESELFYLLLLDLTFDNFGAIFVHHYKLRGFGRLCGIRCLFSSPLKIEFVRVLFAFVCLLTSVL